MDWINLNTVVIFGGCWLAALYLGDVIAALAPREREEDEDE